MPFCLFFVSESSIARHAAILIDADNGNVLYEQDSTQPWYPASLTKAMTLYMVFEALKQGQIQLQDAMTASYHASRQPNSKLGLHAGDKITVEEGILAIITRSANDAAVVLAEHLAGTELNFATQMTTKAHNLGMIDSHYMNATGLPHNWQVTTAKDMATLAWRTQRDHPEYYPYFAARSFIFNGRELKGINKFTAKYPGAEGMKTGFTCGSGYNLISTARQNAKRLIGVVLGGMTSAQRYQLMIDMMDNGFANQTDIDSGKNIATLPPSSGGTPPYLLGCGQGASRSMAVDYDTPVVHERVTAHRTRQTIRKIVRLRNHRAVVAMSRSLAKPRAISKSKSVTKARSVTRTKVASKARPVSKVAMKAYRHPNQH